ncbi:hypothetical protein [Streptomyces rimosus]|uniref:hypothetical protein n=1 Tax=Streptomyces rimosus TaxID=1927 RepID=UPI0037D71508
MWLLGLGPSFLAPALIYPFCMTRVVSQRTAVGRAPKGALFRFAKDRTHEDISPLDPTEILRRIAHGSQGVAVSKGDELRLVLTDTGVTFKPLSLYRPGAGAHRSPRPASAQQCNPLGQLGPVTGRLRSLRLHRDQALLVHRQVLGGAVLAGQEVRCLHVQAGCHLADVLHPQPGSEQFPYVQHPVHRAS